MSRVKENFDNMINLIIKVGEIKDHEKIELIKHELLTYTSIQNIEYSIMYEDIKKQLTGNAP